MEFSNLLFLIQFFVLASARIYSIENEDGSYTIGHSSDSRGDVPNSVSALLSKAAGFTIDDSYEDEFEPEMSDKAESRVLSPHLEILQLIEVFLRFKGELAARFYDVVTDNYDLIRSVYRTVISKLGTMHTFTLVGIKILRKILEFAVTLMINWQVNAPGVSLDLNVGSGYGTHNRPSSSNSNNFFNLN